jgi:hypothetical protein
VVSAIPLLASIRRPSHPSVVSFASLIQSFWRSGGKKRAKRWPHSAAVGR